ncbi:MAG: phosphogluconate dehydratase [Robiginitomaculum sp.]|nr:MAG: phosphogluconate dehydratase [Robiginitomaculum sp.]
MKLNNTLIQVTDRIIRRSDKTRTRYLDQIRAAGQQGPGRSRLSCGNLAHGIAASSGEDKAALKTGGKTNIGIVTSYNDMLSAHQPFAEYPDIIKQALHEIGAVAQVAGGVPAMCDGVTQGQPGMELSLFSRDVIAMATAIALSHNMFDGVVLLGVCDKIIPGLLIGALSFGHLPAICIPAGPMRSGLPNPEKARIRQLFSQGKISKDELLTAEIKSYHSPGTCTFYGTANSNQMLMEVMGLHMPGAAFANPDTELRGALTKAAAQRCASIGISSDAYTPLGQLIDERTIVNAIVGLHATGGSTNHTIHLVAIARAAGIHIDWTDFDELGSITPLLCRIYPNGPADVNHFTKVGGLGLVIGELLDNGLLHEDVQTVAGSGLRAYASQPIVQDEALSWQPAVAASLDENIIRSYAKPFAKTGGLKLLTGSLGRAIIKISAVQPIHQIVRAPAAVFHSQDEFLDQYNAGQLERDMIAVLRFQGPRANGMPELHKLTPCLGTLQDKGFAVALVTDGRMSGASGKVPAAIHVSPEAALGGALGKVMDDDMILLDAVAGRLEIEVSTRQWARRSQTILPETIQTGMGRELFSGFRQLTGTAEQGALSIPGLGDLPEQEGS